MLLYYMFRSTWKKKFKRLTNVRSWFSKFQGGWNLVLGHLVIDT